MKFNEKDYELWNKLTFKTISYRKNFDITYEDENFLTEHEGVISEVRIDEKKPPFQVGEFQFTVWNLDFAREFKIKLQSNLKNHYIEDAYSELLSVTKNGMLVLNNVNKLIILHTLVIHPDYRKRGITEEFMEFLYRDYVYDKNLLIALVKPIQENKIDFDYFWNENVLYVRNSIKRGMQFDEIKAKDYYGLENLIKNDDNEMIEYKLFSLAARCGYNRIDESHLFKFDPTIIMNRLKEKRKYINKLGHDEWL